MLPAPVAAAGQRSATAEPGDARGAGAAVGVDHVAVHAGGVLAELIQVDHGAERTADQPLDLHRAPALLAGGGFTPLRSWVEAGSMPYSQVTHPPGTFCAFIQGGTFASTLTAQITLVPPHSISTEASG